MSAERQQTEIGEFPSTWEVNRVDSAFDIQQGKQVSKKNRAGNNQRPFLRTKNVFWNRLELSDLDQMHFTEAEESRLKLRTDDLLVCEGGSIGRTAIWNSEVDGCLYQNHLHRLRAKGEKAEPQFGVYWLWYAFDVAKLYFGRGNVTTIPNLSQSKLAELPIALPPLPEQKKIAHILSAVQRSIEAQERIIQTTNELKKALMHKLFTEGLRNEPEKQTEIGPVPESWEVVPCQEVCEKITVGIVVKPSSYYVPKGVPAFRSQNVREDRLQLEPMVYISEKANDGPVAKSKLSTGDVLIVRTGYPGTSCVVPPEFDGSNCIDLIIIRPNTAKLQSHYLSRFFNSDAAKVQVQAGKIGLAQQHFNVGAVKRTLVPIPSKTEQNKIVVNLELIDTKYNSATSKRDLLQELFRTLLHELMTARTRVHNLEIPKLELAAN
ncbi:MAG: restriction endonuclease subunit S [Gammaproteobacteria bacterium]|nr:restriction endonuclease subunit S [Gammaproteobacteria bacterium]